MSSGAHILIIEDDPTFCALLAEILEQEGYRVTTRDNGRAGLMCLQRHACDPSKAFPCFSGCISKGNILLSPLCLFSKAIPAVWTTNQDAGCIAFHIIS